MGTRLNPVKEAERRKYLVRPPNMPSGVGNKLAHTTSKLKLRVGENLQSLTSRTKYGIAKENSRCSGATLGLEPRNFDDEAVRFEDAIGDENKTVWDVILLTEEEFYEDTSTERAVEQDAPRGLSTTAVLTSEPTLTAPNNGARPADRETVLPIHSAIFSAASSTFQGLDSTRITEDLAGLASRAPSAGSETSGINQGGTISWSKNVTDLLASVNDDSVNDNENPGSDDLAVVQRGERLRAVSFTACFRDLFILVEWLRLFALYTLENACLVPLKMYGKAIRSRLRARKSEQLRDYEQSSCQTDIECKKLARVHVLTATTSIDSSTFSSAEPISGSPIGLDFEENDEESTAAFVVEGGQVPVSSMAQFNAFLDNNAAYNPRGSLLHSVEPKVDGRDIYEKPVRADADSRKVSLAEDESIESLSPFAAFELPTVVSLDNESANSDDKASTAASSSALPMPPVLQDIQPIAAKATSRDDYTEYTTTEEDGREHKERILDDEAFASYENYGKSNKPGGQMISAIREVKNAPKSLLRSIGGLIRSNEDMRFASARSARKTTILLQDIFTNEMSAVCLARRGAPFRLLVTRDVDLTSRVRAKVTAEPLDDFSCNIVFARERGENTAKDIYVSFINEAHRRFLAHTTHGKPTF
jgi:hypothetical protein